MNAGGSITHWIHDIKSGDADAAQKLWERYFLQLVRLARHHLRGGNRRVTDEEDVVVTVFDKFFRAAEEGRFPNLADRDALWRLLVRMTARQAVDQLRINSRKRRGGAKVRGESAFDEPERPNSPKTIAQIIGDTPTPEFCAAITEQFDRLMRILDDDALRQLAIGKMEGYTNDEMAARLDCSLRTLERRLRLIRERWQQELLE
jgi:RNA polymerase sigma factor (sigma-70 family)